MRKKHVLIFRPWLSVPFKNTGATNLVNDETNLPPIRKHWKTFLENLQLQLSHRANITLKIVHAPLWKLEEEFHNVIAQEKPDVVFFPHRNSQQLWSNHTKIYYYMQSVFPWIFTVDTQGWGGTHSMYPFNPDHGNLNYDLWNSFQEYIGRNSSKFEQPKSEVKLPKNYILFPCQIPHDETIKFHSNFTVEHVLNQLLLWANSKDVNVIVKGHPVNPGAMQRLKNLTSMHSSGIWVDNVSIHQAIRESDAVFTVNSGTGFEALLHEKPVVTFGQAEYDTVTTPIHDEITFDALDSAYDDCPYRKDDYVRMLDAFVNFYGFDGKHPESFEKLSL